MWKIYKWNGHYIQGDFISKHSSEDAALKKAAKEINFTFAEKVKRGKVLIIYNFLFTCRVSADFSP